MATTDRVTVIGAGIAGLVAAVDLAARGVEVVVVERADGPGGKMREVTVEGARIDAGPTVFTLRSVFEAIFADAGASLAEHVTLTPTTTLARHAWSASERLDLFADAHRSADAIGALAGPGEARRYLAFCDHARRVYDTLDRPFIRAMRPSLLGLVNGVGPGRLGDLWRINPFATLWGALGEHFHDPRLRQLFGRYATYCGSSPFQAPATLMLVAHVEREGVWLVEGGMRRLAFALAGLAERLGAVFRYGAEVRSVLADGGRAAGVTLADGERVDSRAVIVNADTAAVADGLFGGGVARAVPPTKPSERSLSAITFALLAETEGFPLLRHNVFFSGDYAAEFDAIFKHGRTPAEPTVYVCAQDRDGDGTAPAGRERLLCLINAPPNGDAHPLDATEIERCAATTFSFLERHGLTVRRRREASVTTTPADFHRLFPATGGALYGRASHGWQASFARPGAASRVPGLYLAGGSTHPGPGVPMAALSGRMAAARLLSDWGSIGRSRKTATPGGTSTR